MGVLVLILEGCAAPAVSGPVATVTVFPSPTVSPTSTPTATATTTATPTFAPTVSLGFLAAQEPPLPATPVLTPEAAATPTPLPDDWMLPARVIPAPCGVNIHFTRPDPGELNLLAAAGFRFVRMDLFWHLVEQSPGRYDFSQYDALVEMMAARGIRIIMILDYGNNLYGGGDAHHSDEGRAAFARFAATAARRYRGRGIIWEVWNEPNIDKFWHAPPDPENYAQLGFAVIDAIRRGDPTAWIVGPATAGFPWEYFERLAELGLFNRLDAISVHPYRYESPETAWSDYVRLRALLDRVSPDRRLPIISSEWGYTTVENGPTEEEQARYLVRQYLFHLASDVELSIWYDWRNDGDDPHEIEYNFGVVTAALEPKLSYTAAQTLLTTLDGYGFRRRIPLDNPADYALLFSDGARVALALWTTGAAHTVSLPILCDTVDVVELLGETHTVAVGAEGLEVQLGPSPRYVQLCDAESSLRLGLWRPVDSMQRLPADGAGRILVEVKNPFYETLQGMLEVRVADAVVGSARVQVRAEELAKVSIPVTLPAPQPGLTQATVRFVMPDELPLQSAVVWLQIQAP